METLLALTVGLMVAVAVYQLLSRNLLRLLFGFILLGNAVNLAIFTAGRLTAGAPPLIAADQTTLSGLTANPLPQALILTAIVIGFGLTAFAFVLVYRGHTSLGTIDSDAMRVAEPVPGTEAPPRPAAPKGAAAETAAAERSAAA